MAATATEWPLHLSTTGPGPILKLLYSRLDEVQQHLDRRGVKYWVSENVFSFDGGPEWIKIHFGFKGDADAIQKVLDEIP